MFEKASQMKLRFETKKGDLTTEELWDLPLTSKNGVSLDDIAKGINRSLRESSEESFVETPSKANSLLALKLDIVKHIIAKRLEATEEAKNAAAKKAEKEKLLTIKAAKQNKALEELSLEEIDKLLASL